MKDTFFKSTIILLIGGLITKILGMIIKIVMTRVVGVNGISLYMLIFPTFSLFMTISQLGFPTAISKLISEDTHNNKRLVLSIIPISMILNIILIVIIIIIAPILTKLLNDDRALYPILAIALVIPFDSLSSILRGYFFGKQKMFPHILSLIIEQIVRLTLIVIIIPNIGSKNIIEAVTILVGINMFSEFTSIIVLLLFIKKKRISKSEIVIDKVEVKNVLSISIPTTISRLVGSISYFFEPIIITTSLLNVGYNSTFIIEEYGTIEGLVLPLLLMPSFLTNALSSALIPDISKNYARGDLKAIRRRVKQVIKVSLVIGIISLSILAINPSFFLKLLYKVDNGSNYVRILIPFFIVLYIEYPFESILQALNKSKNIMYNNLIGTSLKLIAVFLLSYLRIGLYNFIIAMIINILITTLLHYKKIKSVLY